MSLIVFYHTIKFDDYFDFDVELSFWFNDGAYLTFKSIFHKPLNLFKIDCESTLKWFLKPTST